MGTKDTKIINIEGDIYTNKKEEKDVKSKIEEEYKEREKEREREVR